MAGDSLADDELECLADSEGLQCIDCGLCDGSKRNIAITVHGSKASNFKSSLIPTTQVAQENKTMEIKELDIVEYKVIGGYLMRGKVVLVTHNTQGEPIVCIDNFANRRKVSEVKKFN